MQTGASVIVKKGGFWASLVSGFFGLLMTTVICGSGLGAYAIHVFDKKTGDLTDVGGRLLENLPKWREALPPALADAVNDRPAVEYREHLDVSVQLGKTGRAGQRKAVLRIENRGSETISVLAINLVLKDADGVPIGDRVTYAATPVAFDDDWRGPILPGSVREFTRWVSDGEKASAIGYEITTLRVLEPRAAPSDPVARSD